MTPPTPGWIGVVLAVLVILLAVIMAFMGHLRWELAALFIMLGAARLT